MQIVWFLLLAAMLTVYAVLDGFDLGVGALLPWVCRTDSERLQVRDSIGPVWNGNEVWLIASGGAMFAAFPHLYAASFSGFYLALILVLWLLILRGVGFEFRHAHAHPLWAGLWDFVFSAASVVLAVLFGVAFGNVLRGVPFNAQGYFQGSFTLLLNPFALLGGLLSLMVLCLHGATYLAMKTEGDLQLRARKAAGGTWIAAFAAAIIFTVASAWVHPDFEINFMREPVLFVVPLAALAVLIAIPFLIRKETDTLLFAASCTLIVGLLGSAVAGLFPHLLPALRGDVYPGLTIYNASSPHHSLVTALVMNLVGMTAVVAYTVAVYRVWNGKVRHVSEYMK